MARVLIVDDSDVSRQIAAMALKPHEIIEAKNGLEGITRFKASHVMENPVHLVLMDYNMPGLDGLKTIEKMRTYEREINARRTPIAIITTQEHIGDSVRNNQDIDEFLTKPVRLPQIKALADKYLK